MSHLPVKFAGVCLPVFILVLSAGNSHAAEVTEGSQALAAVRQMGGEVSFLGQGPERTLAVQFGCRAKLTDAGIAVLASLRQLESLSCTPALRDGQLAALASQRSIRSLRINAGEITDAGLKSLKTLPLRQLTLRQASYTPAGLDDLLQGLSALESLTFMLGSVTDDGLHGVRHLKRLQQFELADCKVTDRGLAHLAGLQGLQSLSLVRLADVSDAGLGSLAALTDLETVRLSSVPLTDDGLAGLRGLAKLRKLTLYSTRVSREAVRQFRAGRPDVEIDYAP